jgi:hypothetical protein
MKVVRTWEVTISDEVIADLQEKDYELSALLLVLSDYANMGELDTVYYVEVRNEETGQTSRMWGNYNDVMFDDAKTLYTVEEWDAKELKWTVQV